MNGLNNLKRNNMKAQLVKRQDRFDLYNESDGSKIASTLPNPMGKLSLKNCQAIENGYDLDELAREACNITDPLRLDSQKYKQDPYFKIGFNKGFQKALEILGDKKFSESNLRIGCSSLLNLEKEEGELSEVFTEKQYRHIDNYIQSLQHVEWDVEVEMEPYIVGGNEDFVGDGETHIIETKLRPQLDADGCLILKRK